MLMATKSVFLDDIVRFVHDPELLTPEFAQLYDMCDDGLLVNGLQSVAVFGSRKGILLHTFTDCEDIAADVGRYLGESFSPDDESAVKKWISAICRELLGMAGTIQRDYPRLDVFVGDDSNPSFTGLEIALFIDEKNIDMLDTLVSSFYEKSAQWYADALAAAIDKEELHG